MLLDKDTREVIVRFKIPIKGHAFFDAVINAYDDQSDEEAINNFIAQNSRELLVWLTNRCIDREYGISYEMEKVIISPATNNLDEVEREILD